MTKTVSFLAAVLSVGFLCSSSARADNLSNNVKKAVEQSTLDQPGTHPFHLKATYAPSFERDADSHRNGEMEIWWQSPDQWRREVRAPGFHQVLVKSGGHEWQKNDGDFFPEWLRELAVAVVRPVPMPMDVLQQRIGEAQSHAIRLPAKPGGTGFEQINFDWEATKEVGDAQSNGKGHLALLNGSLFYTGGSGFGGLYHDFKEFHGRQIAYTVASGVPEVTAKISLLEDLGSVPSDFFDTRTPGGDAELIETAVVDEAELRKALLTSKPFSWPPVMNGPFEGMAGTVVTIDRTGRIREMDKPISDNPAMRDAAEEGFRAMQFAPIMRNGIAVEATGRLSVAFKTTRPAGVESFESARSYFERGRTMSSLGAGAKASYVMRAEFQAGGASGKIENGRYEDTWISATEWKREAWFASSHLVRSQIGDKHYLLSEGPEAGLLRIVMMILEPIPAGDTMTESDWRIRRDTVEGIKAIRVFRGPEAENGDLDPKTSQGYWFAESGELLKIYVTGLEIRPILHQSYDGVSVARRIDVLKDGKVALRLNVTAIGPTEPTVAKDFKLKGHEWQRAFTAEVR